MSGRGLIWREAVAGRPSEWLVETCGSAREFGGAVGAPSLEAAERYGRECMSVYGYRPDAVRVLERSELESRGTGDGRTFVAYRVFPAAWVEGAGVPALGRYFGKLEG